MPPLCGDTPDGVGYGDSREDVAANGIERNLQLLAVVQLVNKLVELRGRHLLVSCAVVLAAEYLTI